ncbi:MAG: heme exporter protein CcmB, partial [Caldimonas sp.]
VVWVSALLAAMLSVSQLYAGDLADGSLEQMLLAPGSRLAVVTAKAASHWLLTGLPLVVAAPLFGVMLDMRGEAIGALFASLLLGTPVLSLLGGLGAALTLGLRSGSVLLILLIVPLTIPTLVFGAGAAAAADAGGPTNGHFSVLGALFIFTALLAPPATAAALRIATD